MQGGIDDDFLTQFNDLLAEGEPPAIDLSDDAIVDFIGRQPTVVRKTLDHIERAEPWVADADWEAVDALVNLGRELTTDDLRELGSSPSADLVKVLGYVRMSRALLMVNRMLDEGGEQAESTFLSRCKEATAGEPEGTMAFKLVLNRLLYLKRARLIQRIYSPKRANRIMDALKSVTLQ